MKIAALLALLLFWATLGFGQQIEYSIQANSGLFRFGGRSDYNNTNTTYVKKPGWSYGVAAQVQKVTPKNFIYGFQAGYEILRSSVEFQQTYLLVNSEFPVVTSYKFILLHRYNFINTNPFIGQRFILNNIVLDFNAGLDLSYCLESHEKSKATNNNGQTYTSNRERDKPGIDTRARVGIAAYYRQVGLTAGYAHGLKNYTSQTEGANLANYARLIRFGLVYKV